MHYDVAIIGAGVIGLACAERLAAGGRTVVVIERHGTFGQETSSRNSEVIHAGIYYPPESRKAALCAAGNASLYAWCERWGIRHARLGKYIVATCAEEEPQLELLLERARTNGVRRIERVSGAQIQQEEPRVRATAGLWSPDTGIVDSHGLMTSLLQVAQDQGVDFAWKHTLNRVDPEGSHYALHAKDPEGGDAMVTARCVVNAAGLASDHVAELAGIDVDAAGYRLTYVKGHYFRVRGRSLVRHLIYPVPPAIGLGIHVTVDLEGGVRLGPDTEVLRTRAIDYRVPASLAPKFLAAASRYLTGLTLEDLSEDQAGIRPRLGDFVITEESARGLPGWVNLIGVESPGLTCCLSIAEEVSDVLAHWQ